LHRQYLFAASKLSGDIHHNREIPQPKLTKLNETDSWFCARANSKPKTDLKTAD
jgi:hypothetical protein